MDSLDSFDLNDLPEQQPRSSLRGTIILWLVAISGIILLVPLYLVSNTVRSDVTRLDSNLQAAQMALAVEAPPEPEVQALMDDLAQVQGSVDEIEAAYSAIAASHTNWPAVMAAIGNYDPSQLALTSITQSDTRVTLNGRAIDDTAVVAYSQALEESHLFSRVVVQSVRLVATPFASPTSATTEPGVTATSATAVTPTVTPTPTLNPADAYETDDFAPQPIFLGQSQLHNFYPIYDVDKVQFLAKADRYYRVSTVDLSTGVDTFLTVIAGGVTYTNDDREPGVLSSEIVFQVGAGNDAATTVKITNRGQYDPDSWYQIVVEEIIPTPVPTPTSTPIPAATATPENTPTVTPDLRDRHEPDDIDPKPIAMGETQTHNFYPGNDVDTVEFLAKAGRWYRVSTSDLASGVDTFLAVSLGETTYAGDDRGPGDLSSEIVFQVGTGYDLTALVKVTNRGQYGPDKWYQITIEEIIPAPTPTPTPFPTATPEGVPTPTPDWRDVYEPDDTVPKPIAMGETQTHNFYPDDDVDTVEFLAKTGRYYRVSTSGLAQRVDTVLNVSLDGVIYTNDDRGPGDLSSEIVFQVETGYDVYGLVRVTNRGQYGPDEWYQVTVEEIVPTPTPEALSNFSSKLPGVALLVSHFGLSGVFNSNAVEFVIIVELKTESP